MPPRPALDDYQRRRGWLAVPIATAYKFADDQGGYLAALITYYAFVSLFPVLLVAVTVLGFVLHGEPWAQHQILRSALSHLPVVGKEIQRNLHGFAGSGAGLVIGVLGSIYGGLGAAQAGQNAMNTVWAVPRNSRPDPIRSRVRSLAVLATIGAGVLATMGLSVMTARIHFGAAERSLALTLSLALDIGLFIAAFRLLTERSVATRDLLIGAVAAGAVWQLMQLVGAFYVGHVLRNAGELYGLFGLVLGLIAWIHVTSVVVVACAELNVVLRHRLWPRALLTPFTDKVHLTEADERAYTSYAKAARNKGFEDIDVTFRRD